MADDDEKIKEIIKEAEELTKGIDSKAATLVTFTTNIKNQTKLATSPLQRAKKNTSAVIASITNPFLLNQLYQPKCLTNEQMTIVQTNINDLKKTLDNLQVELNTFKSLGEKMINLRKLK